jgi:pimeloyl-ACP methyl ester carboxylesterase
MRTATSADGTPIAYVQTGTGPYLILVHGTATVRAVWAPIFHRHFTTVAMDRRGRGDSGDSADYAIEREFEDVAAVADSLEGRSIVFGHSYGGLCALGAAMLTDRVAGLILYEPPDWDGRALYSTEQLDRLEELVAAGDYEAVLRAFQTEVVGMPTHEVELLASSPAWPSRVATARTIVRELRAEEGCRFSAERLAALVLPVLLLSGGDSPAELTAGADRLQGLLPNSSRFVMPGQQHIAMYTGPDALVDAVVRFAHEHRLLAQ